VLLAVYSLFICICTPLVVNGMQTQSNKQSDFVTYEKYPTVCGCNWEAVAAHPRGSARVDPHAWHGAQTDSTPAAPTRAGPFVPRAFQPQCSYMYAMPEPAWQAMRAIICWSCWQARCCSLQPLPSAPASCCITEIATNNPTGLNGTSAAPPVSGQHESRLAAAAALQLRTQTETLQKAPSLFTSSFLWGCSHRGWA